MPDVARKIGTVPETRQVKTPRYKCEALIVGGGGV
jgi:hypothetical protein